MGKIRKAKDDEEKKSLLVAQDMKLIRALSGNDKRLRDKALKSLKKWIEQRNARIPFTKEDFMRIWKGLYFTMWMSDKSLIQEECAENIAKLIHISNPESSLKFFKSGLTVLATEWFGIDQWRMNKFLMLVRRVLRQAFEVLKKHEWNLEFVTEFGNILLETVLKKDCSTHLGLTMHINEIYLEELAKVSNGKIDKNLMTEFLRPFIKHLAMLSDDRQIKHLEKFTFHHLMRQSDEGIEYENKFEAWKERGFPGGTIDSMQKVESEDDEVSDEETNDLNSEEIPLDPRAGQVDVILPQLKFDALEIIKVLHESKFADGSTTKGRKSITKLEHEFEKLSKNIYPFGFKRIRLPEYDGYSTKLRKSVNRLVKFEKKLLNDNSKKRKRKNSNILSTTNAKEPKLDSVDFFQSKLQKFIDKSEGKLQNGQTTAKKHNLRKSTKKVLKPKAKKQSELDNTDWAFEDFFRRNSGTWIVHRLHSPENLDNSNRSDTSDPPNKGTEAVSNKSPISAKKSPPNSPKRNSPRNHNALENGTSTKLSPKMRRKSEPLFSQNEWDEPLKQGEVEIFVPSNKFKKKMEVKAKKEGKSLSDVLNDSLDKLVKNRHSLDSSDLVRNPFAGNGTLSKSEKRVKIDLKLNMSQEIHEHQAQIKSSPAIPFDANKKPMKPLLKPNTIKSPINPFYRRKLKL